MAMVAAVESTPQYMPHMSSASAAVTGLAVPGLGDLLVRACSESLPGVSRVRGVAVGVTRGGDGAFAHDECGWVESGGVVFL